MKLRSKAKSWKAKGMSKFEGSRLSSEQDTLCFSFSFKFFFFLDFAWITDQLPVWPNDALFFITTERPAGRNGAVAFVSYVATNTLIVYFNTSCRSPRLLCKSVRGYTRQPYLIHSNTGRLERVAVLVVQHVRVLYDNTMLIKFALHDSVTTNGTRSTLSAVTRGPRSSVWNRRLLSHFLLFAWLLINFKQFTPGTAHKMRIFTVKFCVYYIHIYDYTSFKCWLYLFFESFIADFIRKFLRSWMCSTLDLMCSKRPTKNYNKYNFRLTLSLCSAFIFCVADHNQRTPHRTNTEKSLQNKKRVIQMLFVVVLEFFICWTPLYVINTIALFDQKWVYQTLGYTAISYCQLLAYSSSCCNPITYCFMNRGFRKACLNLFRCCKRIHETRRISIGGGPIGVTQSSDVT